MFRRVLLALVAMVVLAAVPMSPAVRAQPSRKAEQKKECTVYSTKTGQRYHRDGCSSLRRSRIPMNRTDAIKRGLTPCKRCGGSDCDR